MKKDNIIFALYVTVAVVNITYGVTEVYKTFKRDKPMRDQIKEAKKED